jgi:hypothetical protein
VVSLVKYQRPYLFLTLWLKYHYILQKELRYEQYKYEAKNLKLSRNFPKFPENNGNLLAQTGSTS